MFKHILLPTDGSNLSQVAIRKGVQFAKSIGAKVTGLCVIPSQKHYLYLTEITDQLKEETARQHKLQADRNLALVEKAAKEAGVPCETSCETSDQPHESIIQVAEKRGCDLIMMASHGRKGVAGLLLGSETQKVLTHSRMPVLVFR
ncbi:MAG: universal stress protein [Desulfobacterales bacterium]